MDKDTFEEVVDVILNDNTQIHLFDELDEFKGKKLIIFNAIMEMHNQDMCITPITLINKLEANGLLEIVGEEEYLLKHIRNIKDRDVLNPDNYLIENIQNIFKLKGLDKIASSELVSILIDRGLWTCATPKKLANLLKKYGIHPSNIKFSKFDVRKGYKRDQFNVNCGQKQVGNSYLEEDNFKAIKTVHNTLIDNIPFEKYMRPWHRKRSFNTLVNKLKRQYGHFTFEEFMNLIHSCPNIFSKRMEEFTLELMFKFQDDFKN